jgi:hypothetical protein
MDNLDQKIQQGIQDYMVKKQYDYSKIPSHEHNGVDTVKISQENVIPNNGYGALLVSVTSETFIITGMPDISSITVYGIAALGTYGAGGYTKKASFAGEARVAPTYGLVGNLPGFASNVLAPDTSSHSPFVQMCTTTYLDDSSAANSFVIATGQALAYAWNGTSDVAKASIISIKNSQITIQVTLAAGWFIEYYIVVS